MNYRKIKLFLWILGLFFSAWSHAFPCYLTVVKDKCWEDYSVSVDVLDTNEHKKILTAEIAKGAEWTRSSFECSSKQIFDFIAKFSPSFWDRDEDSSYHAKRYLILPDAVKGEVAWNITICYPGDFSGVPMPPEANNHCGCDTSNIPPIV